tara:strand:+ start:815 stop:1219 length:405 start_codon:yes stop_codon:yes gene_type:complete
MKNLLILLLFIPMIFISCLEDDEYPSEYYGYWSGNIEDPSESTIVMHIGPGGDFSATIADSVYSMNLTGHVDKDGFINGDWSEVVIYNGTDSIDWRITIDGNLDYPTAFGTYELQEIITNSNYTTYPLTMNKIQ